MPRRAIKKTISLPEDLLAELQQQAKTENKTLSGVIQEGLLLAKRLRVRQELHELQRYWSLRAQERGIVSERDLDRYLSE